MDEIVILEYPTTGARVEATRGSDGRFRLELSSVLTAELAERVGIVVRDVPAAEVLAVACRLGEWPGRWGRMLATPARAGDATPVYLAFGTRIPAYGYMNGGALDVSCRLGTLDELDALNTGHEDGEAPWRSVAELTPDGLRLVAYWLPGATTVGEVLHELQYYGGYESTDLRWTDDDAAYETPDLDPWHRAVCARLTR